MSKTYKVLSVLLAVAMLFSVVAVSAFAAYTPTDTDKSGNAYTQTWALSEPTNNGDGTWSVNVSLTTNYPVGSIQFKIANTNNTGVKLTKAVKGAAFANDANVTFSNATGKVTIVPKTTGKTNLACAVVNGVIATLTYTVESGASADINIVNDPKGTVGTDVGGSLIATRCGTAQLVGDYIADGPGVYGQTVLGVGESRHIGKTATPKLAVVEGKGGVIDTNRGYVYGIDVVEGETVQDVFTVTDGGDFEITANKFGGAETGTGSILTVVDANGDPTGEEYYIVIFGDVTGDGWMDPDDTAYVLQYDAGVREDLSVLGDLGDDFYLFAGDVTGDAYADPDDTAYILQVDAGVKESLPYTAAQLAQMNYNN